MRQIHIKIFMKKHLFASYELVCTSEEQLDEFTTLLNSGLDYIRVGDELIERTKIRKVTIKDE